MRKTTLQSSQTNLKIDVSRFRDKESPNTPQIIIEPIGEETEESKNTIVSSAKPLSKSRFKKISKHLKVHFEGGSETSFNSSDPQDVYDAIENKSKIAEFKKSNKFTKELSNIK